MLIRPIRAEEFLTFTVISEQADLNALFRANLMLLGARGNVYPEWCFVAEEEGQLIGRLVYWTLPSLRVPLYLHLLEVPWEGDYLAVGSRLFQESLAQVAVPAMEQLHYVLDTPSPWSTYPEQRMELVEHLGFQLTRETVRFEMAPVEASTAREQRLLFRSLHEVGEERFIEAIMQVSEGTLDRWIQQDRERLGAREAAREYLRMSHALKTRSEWQQLAFTRDGTLLGLILLAENDAGPVIDYIGVVPTQRGQGYIHDLLARVPHLLQSGEARSIRADTDVLNVPVITAFLRAGYRQFATRRDYSLRL